MKAERNDAQENKQLPEQAVPFSPNDSASSADSTWRRLCAVVQSYFSSSSPHKRAL